MTGDELVSWDDYAAERAITKNEAPQAFAAYLYEVTNGGWDGEVEQVNDDPGAGQSDPRR